MVLHPRIYIGYNRLQLNRNANHYARKHLLCLYASNAEAFTGLFAGNGIELI